MSDLLKLNLKDVLGAILSGVIVAVLGYLSSITNIFDIDVNMLLNIAITAAIASLVKSLGTNSEGKFLGMKVK